MHTAPPPSPIRTIRRRQGLTAEQLAAKAGLASATVYRAERGIGTPGEQTLTAIAGVLGVTLQELHGPEAATASTACGPHPEKTPAPTDAATRQPVGA